MFQPYAVSQKGTSQELRVALEPCLQFDVARNRVRDAIASGFDYGYVKEHGSTVAFLTEKSFTVSRIAD